MGIQRQCVPSCKISHAETTSCSVETTLRLKTKIKRHWRCSASCQLLVWEKPSAVLKLEDNVTLARMGHSLGRLLHYQLPCWTLILILWPFCLFGYSLHHGHKLPIMAYLHSEFVVCIKMRLVSCNKWGLRGFPTIQTVPGLDPTLGGPFAMLPKAIFSETTRSSCMLTDLLASSWLAYKYPGPLGRWERAMEPALCNRGSLLPQCVHTPFCQALEGRPRPFAFPELSLSMLWSSLSTQNMPLCELWAGICKTDGVGACFPA